jgi:peptide/nickel transport system substrate-binding protein
MKRSPMGQKLEATLDALEVVDDRRLRFRLKRPFPRLLNALGSVASPAPIIMPERLALTDPYQQVREMIGSGPYRFIAADYNSGSLSAYEKFDAYSPTPGGQPSLTAGPKIAHIDRIEWHVITDHATAAAALQRGEMDWYENVPVEIQQLLRRSRDITVERLDPLPSTGVLRFNFLHPIFNDKRMRQALLPAISQADFMQSIVGTDPDLWRAGAGMFTPGTPLANDAGLGPLDGPRSLDRAKALLKAAGYTDQPVRVLVPTDILAPSAISQVCADLFRRLGMNLDAPSMDWGTAVQRRTSREPVEKGGWSVVLTTFGSFEFADPAGHFPLRGNGLGGWPGWPSLPQLEALRDAWFDAPDLAAEQAIAREIQTVAMDELPYIPLGAYWTNTARRRTVTDRVPGFAIFWNLKKA